jgi:hypothetical protein
MLKNKLYRIDKWMSKGSRLGIVLLLIGASAVMLQFTPTMFYGISLMGLICLWVVFVKTRISTGVLKFDKSLYTLPTIGETIVVQKDFKYDLSKVTNSKNYIHNKAIIDIGKGFEFDVVNIKELTDDWIIELEFITKSSKGLTIEVFWLDVKNYFMTIADIREEKLKKILNEN